jgi:VanZ family protein
MNYKYSILALLGILLIDCMSSIPGGSIPNNGLFDNRIISNFAHISLYALITFLWLKAFKREDSSWSSIGNMMILFGLIIVALFDEVHQSSVPDRTASLRDIGFDLAGILFGTATFRFVSNFKFFAKNR